VEGGSVWRIMLKCILLIRSVEPSYLLHAMKCELLRYLQRFFRSKSPWTLGALNVAILLQVCLQVWFQIHIQCKSFITDRAVVIFRAWKEDVWLKDILSSSSSSGPKAYAPDAPQPIGLLCDPCPPMIFKRSHFRRQEPPCPYDARDPSSERWNCGWECWPVISPKCQFPHFI
jgi:hypothetical protein